MWCIGLTVAQYIVIILVIFTFFYSVLFKAPPQIHFYSSSYSSIAANESEVFHIHKKKLTSALQINVHSNT